jgi:hypothetical protein
MNSRRIEILRQALTPEGCLVGYRGLTHHEAVTEYLGLLQRGENSRYHLTEQGRKYLAVMRASTPI